MSAQVLTHKQASCLFRFTLLKFWEPENTPPPTIGEASDMIGLCMKWLKEKDNRAALKAQLVALVRRWFPDWTGDTLAPRFGARKKSEGTGNGGEDGKQTPAAEHEPEHKAEQPELPAAAELPPRAEAPQASRTSASTVGLPRESRISRAKRASMRVFMRASTGLCLHTENSVTQ